MCKLAAEENPFFEVDDLELHRPGESYTIDTVRALKARGWGRVSWLIGADQLPALPRWREAEKLIEEADLLVMARPGWSFDFDSLPEPFRRLRSAVVAAPSIDISATDIRRRVRAHEPIDHLTPPAVARYIETHGLYR
jgi:nicotinate-nucleotide adenylyltransferase